MDHLKLFQKQKEIMEKKKETPFLHLAPNQEIVNKILNTSIDHNRIEGLSFNLEWSAKVEGNPRDARELLAELSGSFKENRWDELLYSVGKDTLKTVAGTFGLGNVLAAYDKTGGSVDTVHNVRQGVYATDTEKNAYENRGTYDSDAVHKDKAYIDENRKQTGAFKNGEQPINPYTGLPLTQGNEDGKQKVDLDHVISAHQIHNDPGRVLAEKGTSEIANKESNLKLTGASTNRSKKDKSPEEYARYVEENKDKWINRASQLEQKKATGELTDKERKELTSLHERIKIDPDKLREEGKKAQKAQDAEINKAYYTSHKFFYNSVSTSIHEGARMGGQQALGVLITELIASLMDEIRHLMKNGRQGKHFLEDLKERGKRICTQLLAKWRDALTGFTGGFLSGFLSNLLTIAINAFLTTAKRAVRMIREGFHSLLRAVKMILSPPPDITKQEARHEALKLVAAGGITIAGIALEEVVEKLFFSIPFLLPIASLLSSVVVGSLTAIAMAISTYLIDKADFFGAIKIQEDRFVMNALEDKTIKDFRECNNLLDQIDNMLMPSSPFSFA